MLRDFAAVLSGIAIAGSLGGCAFFGGDAPDVSPDPVDLQYQPDMPDSSTSTSSTLDRPVPSESLKVDDIEKRYLLIGKLGKPLGEFSTIRGIWRPTRDAFSKDDPLAFFVTQIDGVATQNDIEINAVLMRDNWAFQHEEWPVPSKGAVWELRVFEDAATFGKPITARKEAGYGGQQGQAGISWGLKSRMNYMSRPRVLDAGRNTGAP